MSFKSFSTAQTTPTKDTSADKPKDTATNNPSPAKPVEASTDAAPSAKS